jgi:YVTN family beta-propeller protein
MSVLVNGKIYLNNRGEDKVTVIDPVSDTVIDTITVGLGPYYLAASGDRVFVANNASNTLSVIDTLTDTVISTHRVGHEPFYLVATHDKVYVPNDNFISILNINELLPPELVSFSSTKPSGTYSAGASINITANFNSALAAGSTMTVLLNSGASVVLNEVSGTSLQGTYAVAVGEKTPDLAVRSVTAASVSDLNGHTRTSYAVPSSAGNFTAENSLISRNIGDSKNIAIGAYRAIPVGSNPYQVSAPIYTNGEDFIYVANQGSASVSVIRKKDNIVVATIPVGLEPYGLSPVAIGGTTYLYVANTGSDSVSVINTATNTVTATVAVGVKPYYTAAIGTNVYVTNGQSNTVSVINANTNLVTATIPVGSYPRGIKAHGLICMLLIMATLIITAAAMP